jgi:branched-chain amino acid transport system substrate-binding protein
MRGIATLAASSFLVAVIGATAATAATGPAIVQPSQLNAKVKSILGPLQKATGSTTVGVSGHTITIAGVADVTAGGVTQFNGICDGAKARFARANRQGGVNGYKINYLGCSDTGSVASTASQLVQNAITQQKVFAVIPFTSSVMAGNPFQTSHTLAFGFGTDTTVYCGWNNNQYDFSSTSAESCTTALGHGQAIFSSTGLAAYVEGAKVNPHTIKVAFIGDQNPETIAAIKAENIIAKGLGMKVAYSSTAIPGPASPPPSDYTPYATAIISSGANLVFNIAGTFGETLGVSAALKANNYKGGQVQFVITDNAALSIAPIANAFDGSYALTSQVGSSVFPSKSNTQVANDLKAIGSTAPAEALGTLTSYGAADMFLAALKHTQGTLTTQKVANFINGGWNYSGYGNTICPSVWPAAHIAASSCGDVVRVSAAAKNVLPILDMGNQGNDYLINVG